ECRNRKCPFPARRNDYIDSGATAFCYLRVESSNATDQILEISRIEIADNSKRGQFRAAQAEIRKYVKNTHPSRTADEPAGRLVSSGRIALCFRADLHRTCCLLSNHSICDRRPHASIQRQLPEQFRVLLCPDKPS